MRVRPAARFAFLVHPLTPGLKSIIAARGRRWGLLAGKRSGEDPEDTRPLCRLMLKAGERSVEGVIVSIPLLPETILSNQELALEMMRVAVAQAGGGIDAVGLGSLLAVTAGRGTELQRHLWQPVTTGAAATAWVAAENTISASRALGSWPHKPVAVLGYTGTVGQAVASYLKEEGASKIVVPASGVQAKRARKAGFAVVSTPEEAAEGCPVVVGASTTGFILDPSSMSRSKLLIDVAIPPTLKGPAPEGVVVLAGEAVSLPSGYSKGGWGSLYHLLAGYGPRHLFACVIEPLLIAVEGRREPFAQGRRVKTEELHKLGQLALRWGFKPALTSGWRTARLEKLLKER